MEILLSRLTGVAGIMDAMTTSLEVMPLMSEENEEELLALEAVLEVALVVMETKRNGARWRF